MSKYNKMMRDTFPVSFWQYWILPIQRFIRYPFNPSKWYLQLTKTTQVKEEGEKPKTISFQRYLKELGKPTQEDKKGSKTL